MKFITLFYDKVDSTNNQAKKLIEANHLNFGFVTSHYQTNGKGQFGKKWISLKGNFFGSFFFSVKNYKEVSKLQFSILKIVLKTLSKYIDTSSLEIKAPNDILIKNKKICGILIESFQYKKKIYSIIGVGLNLLKNPTIKNYQTTNIYKEFGKKINFFDFSDTINKSMKAFF